MTHTEPLPRPWEPPPGWPAATAARVFALAMALGDLLHGREWAGGVVLLGLVLLAAVYSSADLNLPMPLTRVLPVTEGILVTALLLAGGTTYPAAALGYLAVPPIVAGLRAGAVSTVTTALAIALTAALSSLAGNAGEIPTGLVTVWLVIGTVLGLAASVFFRGARRTEERHAAYVEARRLLSDLRSVSDKLPGGLNPTSPTEELLTGVEAAADTVRLAWYDAGRDRPLAERGEPARPAEPAMVVRLTSGPGDVRPARSWPLSRRPAGLPAEPLIEGRMLLVPVTQDDRPVGTLVAVGRGSWTEAEAEAIRRLVEDHRLQLETAALYEEIQRIATAEERSRLARDIHDGIAQEIAALGFLADDLAAGAPDEETREAAEALRGEITRVVSELRLSIFDLRQEVDAPGGLSGALAEYVREVGKRSGLRLHLSFDESPRPMPVRVEGEVLRIAQEALGNVRQHADAENVWLTLHSDASGLLLLIEDDGVGGAAARDGHYGLASMAERAQRIGASLAITDRPDGGTSVAVDLPITTPAGSAALPPPDAPGSTAPRSAKRRTALEGADS